MREISRKDREKLGSDIPDYIKKFDAIITKEFGNVIQTRFHNNDFDTIASVGDNIYLSYRKMIDGILLELNDSAFQFYAPYDFDQNTSLKTLEKARKDTNRIISDFIYYGIANTDTTYADLLTKAMDAIVEKVSINPKEVLRNLLPDTLTVDIA